jgi:elongation factor Ts
MSPTTPTKNAAEGRTNMSETGGITAEMIKQLRELTGAGMMDCKRALAETGGDVEAAVAYLREKNLAGVQKRSGRTASEGVVEAYVHGEGRIGVLVELNSETDFVARTPDFRELAHEVAMQVAATDPRWIVRDDVPEDVVAGERKIYEEQARSSGKPEQVQAKMVQGKLEDYFKQFVLAEQAYIRDPGRTVQDLVTEVAGKVGENLVIRRFARFQLGAEA